MAHSPFGCTVSCCVISTFTMPGQPHAQFVPKGQIQSPMPEEEEVQAFQVDDKAQLPDVVKATKVLSDEKRLLYKKMLHMDFCCSSISSTSLGSSMTMTTCETGFFLHTPRPKELARRTPSCRWHAPFTPGGARLSGSAKTKILIQKQPGRAEEDPQDKAALRLLPASSHARSCPTPLQLVSDRPRVDKRDKFCVCRH